MVESTEEYVVKNWTLVLKVVTELGDKDGFHQSELSKHSSGRQFQCL